MKKELKVSINDDLSDEFNIAEIKNDAKSSRLVNKSDAKRLLNLIGTKKTLEEIDKTDRDNEAKRKELFKKALDSINKKIQMATENPPENLMDVEEFMNEVTSNLSSLNITDDTTTHDIITNELYAWGITNDTDEYTVIATILDLYHDIIEAPSDDEVIQAIADKLGMTTDKVNDTLANIINMAVFANSKYMPVFAKIPREAINRHILIDNILDFCMA